MTHRQPGQGGGTGGRPGRRVYGAQRPRGDGPGPGEKRRGTAGADDRRTVEEFQDAGPIHRAPGRRPGRRSPVLRGPKGIAPGTWNHDQPAEPGLANSGQHRPGRHQKEERPPGDHHGPREPAKRQTVPDPEGRTDARKQRRPAEDGKLRVRPREGPRQRGWTRLHQVRPGGRMAGPAPAGMDLWLDTRPGRREGRPRASGGTWWLPTT